MMKKIIVFALAVIMTGSMAACGMGDVGGVVNSSSGSSSSQTSSSVTSKPDESAYKDTLDGLTKYLTSMSLISGTPSNMQADFIGAAKGVKYQFGLNGKDNVTVEFYEFTDSSNEKASKVISEVKSSGSFTIMNQQVPAMLSDSGKYLMIYKDTTTNNDENKKRQEDVTSAFKAFKKS